MAEKEVITISRGNKKETLQDSNWCFTTLSSLLNNHSSHDVTFKTSDGGSVSGHRAIIAAGSPVFQAMLYGNMKESNEKEITLPSVNTKTCKALLSFMYTGKVEIDSKSCRSILEAAHYFNVAVLENKCVDFIATSLDIENCCAIATFANNKKLDSLLGKCLTFMHSYAYKVIQSTNFKDLPDELIIKFCQSSDLRVEELQLFLAVVKWYQHQKKELTDNTVRKIFQQIRYPLISVSHLLEKVRPTKCADSSLYTSALEFHHMPSKYEGPKIQLVNRKFIDFVNYTTNTMAIDNVDTSVSITKISTSSNWDGLCATQVYLTEQHPVHFKFLLEWSNSDRSGIQIVVRSCSEDSLSAGDNSGGMDGNGFTIGKKVDGVITLKGDTITTTIGDKSMSTTKRHDTITVYLCIYLYYCNNLVTFSA